MDTCIFCKIIKREIPSNIVYEDDHVVVFPDINPMKLIHLLIVPKKHIQEFLHIDDEEFHRIFSIVQKMIVDNNLETRGYRLVMNGGGFQDVDHLHNHLTGPWK